MLRNIRFLSKLSFFEFVADLTPNEILCLHFFGRNNLHLIYYYKRWPMHFIHKEKDSNCN